uniref:Low-density lipoprotein receptor-related protein 1 n=1 Tax=Aceria tosichella TaxID=561515 RepID=A0A6G1SPS9_9ACAR
MHTLIKFTRPFLIILLLTIFITTTATFIACNQTLAQSPWVPKTLLNQSVTTGAPTSAINYGSKQEGKSVVAARKKSGIDRYLLPTTTAPPAQTTEKIQIVETSSFPDASQTFWPSPKSSGPSEDDLVSTAIAEVMNVSSSPSTTTDRLPYPLTPSTTTVYSASATDSVLGGNTGIIDESNRFAKLSTSTSRKPIEFVTVSEQQRSKSRSSTSPPMLVTTNSSVTQSAIKSPASSTSVAHNRSSSPHPLLLYSIRFEIRSYNLSASLNNKQNSDHSESNSASVDQHRLRNSPSKTLIAGLKNAICLDFYYSPPSEGFIFWIDVIEEKIFRGSMSGGVITNVNMIIQGGLSSAEGIAIDWVAKNIYWVESTLDHIEVANMNGSSRRTLIAGDMESPRAISVDPRYGLLFWTDWDKKNPRIERATMSGHDRRTIVDIKEVNGGWPNGLTLDYEALKIYWIDANSDSIHVVDYEGNNPKALLRKTKSLGHPFAITLYENNLYWTDWKTNFISTASKVDGSDHKTNIQRHQTRLFDIKVFHPSRQPKVEDNLNPCAINNGNCSHLCLLSVNSTRFCECPHLMRLTSDNMTCEPYHRVLLIGKSNEIRAVDITKPLHHIMAPITVPKVFGPRQFEYHANSSSIFWADSSTNEVKRAQLSGNNIETIIDVIIEMPNGLSLDWISGNIYVTSASLLTKTGKIFISNLKGEYISILMDHQQGIISPKSIAVHPLLGLLFCIDENEQGEPLIFMAGMDGQNKSIIIARHIDQTLVNPVSLAIDFATDRVYWVNQAPIMTDNATIQYYDIAKNRTITLYNEAELPPEQRIHPGVLCVDGDYLIISSRAPSDNIIRASKDNITDRFVYKTQALDHIMALKVYNASAQVGSNACKLNNGGCSQLCIPINSTARTCKCTMGYITNPSNETECLGKDLFLIYSSNQGMKGISIEPNSSSEDYYLPPIYRAFRASSIEYIYRDNLIYWIDHEESSVVRINRDTTNYQVIIQGLEAEDYIAIDWVAGNIYRLDPYYDVIEISRLNGTNRHVIVSGEIDKANGVVVNPLKGYIVWSDVGTVPKIERAHLDGSGRRVIVNTKVAHIDELAIDFLDDYIYWIDSTLSIIERVRPDGTARKMIYNGQSSVKGSQEHFIAMVIYQKYLYLADASNDGSIVRFHKDNTNDSRVIQHSLGDNIKDITIFAPQPMPSPEENPCVKDNGGCQDLCLYLGETGKRRCICSHGKLKPDGVTCKPHDTFIMYSKLSQIDSLHIEEEESHNNAPYPPITIEAKSHIISLTIDYKARRVIYSEMTQDQICSILFNGTDKKVLVEKQSMVEGIAFEKNQLYWTSIQDNSISRLNISSSGTLDKSCSSTGCKLATVEKIVKLGSDDKPRGIALDSCTSYVYWTNWNNEASIQRASPATGYKIESIIKTNIKVPNGIAIDHQQRKLYWCDARLDKIETCNMDGSNRVILISAMPQHPFALAVFKDHIFWTDWLTRGVFRANKYNGQFAMQIKKVAQRPMGIAVASSEAHTCLRDLCGTNNGGCPAGEYCVTHETENGELQLLCQTSSTQHQLRRLKTTQPDLNYTCSAAVNGTKCREYHAILRDRFERYGFNSGDNQQDDDDKTVELYTDNPRQSIATSTPYTRMIVPKESSVTSSSTLRRTTLTSLETTSIRPIISNSSSNNSVQQSISPITVQKTSTIQPVPIAETTPTSNVTTQTVSQGTSGQPSSSPQPCQVVPDPQQTATTAASPANNCMNPDDFKCYRSEKLICIASDKRCDGNHDCPNREDETDCLTSTRGHLIYKHENNWQKFVTVILIILAAALAALFLVFGNRGRRRWFVGSYNGFNNNKLFEDNGTNIEISNPMFDEDDSVNLVNCPFSIDLNERTTNFSNPLYERQVLLVNEKNPAT